MRYTEPKLEIKEIKLNNDIASAINDWMKTDDAEDEFMLGLSAFSLWS